MSWKPDKLLKAILIWTVLTFVIVWLPLVRGLMDGDSYQWGYSFWGWQASSHGIRGDYWLVVLQAILGVVLLYRGWRGAKQPFHWLLLLWHFSLATQAIYNSETSPEDYRLRGDTLGVDVSLAWVGPVVFGGFALLSLLWVIRDMKKSRERLAPEWTSVNRIVLLIAAGLLPFQFVLLRYGVQHGLRDQVGVILTMLQWVLLNLGLYPWVRRSLSN
ncbi:MAG TPA: hypothetical protein VL866_14135 [Pyrinomonadaceae bacterium]|nr:hypothetical protein [Pyrinomonadaceae bacterium]